MGSAIVESEKEDFRLMFEHGEELLLRERKGVCAVWLPMNREAFIEIDVKSGKTLKQVIEEVFANQKPATHQVRCVSRNLITQTPLYSREPNEAEEFIVKPGDIVILQPRY